MQLRVLLLVFAYSFAVQCFVSEIYSASHPNAVPASLPSAYTQRHEAVVSTQRNLHTRGLDTYVLISDTDFQVQIGSVTIDCTSAGLTLTLTAYDDWKFNDTYIWVGDELHYLAHWSVYSATDSYQLSTVPEGTFRLSVHVRAFRESSRVPDLCRLVESPGCRNSTYTLAYPASSSYFVTTYKSSSYPGWCLDVDRQITPGQTYTAREISSYDPILRDTTNFIDHPENLPLINYVLNQNYPERFCACNWQSVQYALWSLVDSTTLPIEGVNQECVDFIVDDARCHGQNYVPPCGGKYAVLLVPTDPNCTQLPNQVTIIVVIITEDLCVPAYEAVEGYLATIESDAASLDYIDFSLSSCHI